MKRYSREYFEQMKDDRLNDCWECKDCEHFTVDVEDGRFDADGPMGTTVVGGEVYAFGWCDKFDKDYEDIRECERWEE